MQGRKTVLQFMFYTTEDKKPLRDHIRTAVRSLKTQVCKRKALKVDSMFSMQHSPTKLAALLRLGLPLVAPPCPLIGVVRFLARLLLCRATMLQISAASVPLRYRCFSPFS